MLSISRLHIYFTRYGKILNSQSQILSKPITKISSKNIMRADSAAMISPARHQRIWAIFGESLRLMGTASSGFVFLVHTILSARLSILAR